MYINTSNHSLRVKHFIMYNFLLKFFVIHFYNKLTEICRSLGTKIFQTEKKKCSLYLECILISESAWELVPKALA